MDNAAAAGTPDADANTKGKIQLAGDLSGTAASPQIAAGVIVNADINASAAIDQSKISNLTTDLASKIDKSTLDSNSILKADTDDTPIALSVPNSTFIGRKASGNIAAMTVAEAKALLDSSLSSSYAPRVATLIPLTSRTFVSIDQGTSNQSNGTDTLMHTRLRMIAKAGSTNVRVAFSNSYNFGGTPTNNSNSITVRAALETSGGLFFPVWFESGKRDVTIDAGGIAWGECGISLAAGDTFYSRTKVSVASAGQKWPIALGDSCVSGDGEGAVGATVDTDLTTSGTITANTNAGYAPWAILGHSQPATSSIIGVGDSIHAGKGDNSLTGYGRGWVVRALQSKVYMRAAPFSGTTIGQWTAAAGGAASRLLLTNAALTKAVSTLGINDVTGGQTLATIQSRLLALWNQLAVLGITVYQSTLTPVTTSTDSWATTANQTVTATNTVRTQVNDWIRSLPSPLAGCLEVADIVETSRNSGIWKAGYTADGTHPTASTHATIASTLDVSML